MCLEALDDALVHWLDVRCKVWPEILNMDILKPIGDNVARKIVLQKKDLSML